LVHLKKNKCCSWWHFPSFQIMELWFRFWTIILVNICKTELVDVNPIYSLLNVFADSNKYIKTWTISIIMYMSYGINFVLAKCIESKIIEWRLMCRIEKASYRFTPYFAWV
jgi:hypothetical protein